MQVFAASLFHCLAGGFAVALRSGYRFKADTGKEVMSVVSEITVCLLFGASTAYVERAHVAYVSVVCSTRTDLCLRSSRLRIIYIVLGLGLLVHARCSRNFELQQTCALWR